MEVFGKYVANIARTKSWCFMRCRYVRRELICDWTILESFDSQVLILAAIYLCLLDRCSWELIGLPT
jgi:hypothetical protein